MLAGEEQHDWIVKGKLYSIMLFSLSYHCEILHELSMFSQPNVFLTIMITVLWKELLWSQNEMLFIFLSVGHRFHPCAWFKLSSLNLFPPNGSRDFDIIWRIINYYYLKIVNGREEGRGLPSGDVHNYRIASPVHTQQGLMEVRYCRLLMGVYGNPCNIVVAAV